MTSTAHYVHTDERTRWRSKIVDGSDVWLEMDSGSTGEIKFYLPNVNAAASVVVAAQEAHDRLADTEPAREVARLIESALPMTGEATATLANDGPSILVDDANGRSFVVYVREV